MDDPTEESEFQQLISTDEFEEAKQMAATTFEQGVERGIERGRRATLASLLEAKFGPLPTEALDCLERLTSEQITQLPVEIVNADSLCDVALLNIPDPN